MASSMIPSEFSSHRGASSTKYESELSAKRRMGAAAGCLLWTGLFEDPIIDNRVLNRPAKSILPGKAMPHRAMLARKAVFDLSIAPNKRQDYGRSEWPAVCEFIGPMTLRMTVALSNWIIDSRSFENFSSLVAECYRKDIIPRRDP